MRRVYVSLLGLLLLALSMNPASGGVFPYEVQRHTLDNKLKVLLIPMPADGVVSYWSVVRTGSRDEVEEGVTGFAHFFEHMMFRGSEKFPAEVYDNIVASMGADANAFTTDDLTGYYLSLTKQDLPLAIEIEADRFQNLQYTQAEFKTESGAVYGEFRKNRTNPFFTLFEAISYAAFDKHTYKHTTIGYEEDIKKMPEQYEYAQKFFNRYYRPDNVVIMVIGDFDPRETLALIKKHYGPWKAGYQAPDVPVEPEQKAQRRLEVPFEGQTLPVLALNFKGDALTPKDVTYAAATLIEPLAFGETSSLYKKLVLDEQRVQFLGASFSYNRDPGLWSIYTMVKDPADVAAVEGEIWDTIAGLKNKPVSQDRLEQVRSNMKYGFLAGLSTPQAVANALYRFVALTGDMQVIEDLWRTYEKVTPEDVQRAANHYLRPQRSTVAVLHPESMPLPKPRLAEAPVLLKEEQDPNVAFRLWFKVGSQDDPEGKEGLANLTASLISDGGTESRKYEEILQELFPLAAGYGASVDKEQTIISGSSHREAVEGFYPIFMDAILHPGFREEDFERLRSNAIDTLEKQLRYSSDEELGKATLYGTVFRGTRYEHLDLGTVEGLRSITLDDVKAFHARYYTRDNVVVGMGGAFQDGLVDRITADLQRLPEGTPERRAAPQPRPIEGRQVVLVEKPGESTAISMGYPIDLHRGSKEFYALWLANSWLGEHRNSVSHLYQVIREARGMNYGDYSYIEAFPQGGFRNMPPTGVSRRQQLFEIWIRPVPDHQAIFALRAALREVEHLAKNGLTQEQFEKQREFLKKYVYQFATTTSEKLGYAIDDRFYGIEGEGHLKRFREMMDTITLADVNAAIKKYVQVDDIVIAMVTADAAGMRAKLASGEASPMDYGDLEKPQEVLAEDKHIEVYPLKVAHDVVAVIPVDEVFTSPEVLAKRLP